MDKYKKDRLLGSGTFSTVWLVKSTLSQTSYALKEIGLNSIPESERQRALIEVSVLSKLKHENIIRYKDSMIEDDIGKLSVVMEYAAGGALFTAIVEQRGIPFAEKWVISWFIQICLALQYIHFNKILHRNLATKNIYLTRNKTIKVGDFGVVKILKESEELATTSIGTPYYFSPEICQQRPYNYKSDIWALGCILFEMSALEHPFQARNFKHLLSLIPSGERKKFPRWCGPVIKELVQDLLIFDPAKRPSTNEILASPLLQPYVSTLPFSIISNETLPFSVDDANSFRTGALKDIQENYSEKNQTHSRRYSKDILNAPKIAKLPSRSYSTSVAVAKNLQTLPSMKTEIHIPCAATQEISSQRLPDPSNFKSGRNSTFLVSKNSIGGESRNLLSTEIQTRQEYRTPDVGCGYQSQEAILFSSSEKANSPSKWSTPSSELLDDRCEKQTSPKHVDWEINDSLSEYEDASSNSFTTNQPNSEDFRLNHCQKTQCHQCTIYMLRKSKILACIGVSSVNTNKHCRLKSQLVLIFKDLFQEVYESLLDNWKGMNASSVPIQNLIKTLNDEQMQHLPHVMQLIELDLLTKSSKDKVAS